MQQSEALTIPAVRTSRETMAYLSLSLMSVGWASAFIAGKVVLAEITPLAGAAIRYLMAAAVLSPLAFRALPRLSDVWRVRRPLLIMMVCGGFCYQWLFLLALQNTTATNASLLIALNPVLTMLLGSVAGEGLERRRLPGAFLALLGAAIVITRGDWDRVSALAHGAVQLGDIIAVVAAMCWACFNIASRRVVHVLSAGFTNTFIYAIGGCVLALLSGPANLTSQLSHASTAAWIGLLAMAVLSSAFAGQLFLYGVRVVGVNRTVLFIYLTPVLTAFASVLWLGESLTLAHLAGGAAVLFGVYWSTQG